MKLAPSSLLLRFTIQIKQFRCKWKLRWKHETHCHLSIKYNYKITLWWILTSLCFISSETWKLETNRCCIILKMQTWTGHLSINLKILENFFIIYNIRIKITCTLFIFNCPRRGCILSRAKSTTALVIWPFPFPGEISKIFKPEITTTLLVSTLL